MFIAEPNTNPKIFTAADATKYYDEIRFLCDELDLNEAEIHMLIYLTHEHTTAQIDEAMALPFVRGVKILPFDKKSGKAGTTGAYGGIHNWNAPEIHELLRAVAAHGKVCQIHSEVPDASVHPMLREEKSIPDLTELVNAPLGVKISVEHISTAAMLRAVESFPRGRVIGGITPQHLLKTHADYEAHRRNRCFPWVKTLEDRDALQKKFLEGVNWLVIGDDTAPHDKIKNPNAHGCFNPFTQLLIANLLAKHDKLHLHNQYASGNALKFYNLMHSGRTMTLVEKPWTIPEVIELPGGHCVEPLCGGEEIMFNFEYPL